MPEQHAQPQHVQQPQQLSSRFSAHTNWRAQSGGRRQSRGNSSRRAPTAGGGSRLCQICGRALWCAAVCVCVCCVCACAVCVCVCACCAVCCAAAVRVCVCACVEQICGHPSALGIGCGEARGGRVSMDMDRHQRGQRARGSIVKRLPSHSPRLLCSRSVECRFCQECMTGCTPAGSPECSSKLSASRPD